MAEPTATCELEDHLDARQLLDADAPIEACQRAAAIFRALGDPNRLRLLVLLRGGERCVTELADLLEDGLSAVSQRLKLLRSERLVSCRREGKHIYYALVDQHVVDLVVNALDHACEGDGTNTSLRVSR